MIRLQRDKHIVIHPTIWGNQQLDVYKINQMRTIDRKAPYRL